MEIDRHVIKAVSAQARLRMLKSLQIRKKMPSELSREIGLSPSTVVEHLQNLEAAGLIRRIQTGHKWVYYEITDKGSSIVQPGMPVQFILTLGVGILMVSFGFLKSVYSGIISAGVRKYAAEQAVQTAVSGPGASDAAAKISEGAAQTLPDGWTYFLVSAAGLILMIFSIYRLRKRE